MNSQLSGDLPNALDNFNAIVGETSDSPLIRREKVDGDTSSFMAAVLKLIFSGLM
jgi:hypothetical protein